MPARPSLIEELQRRFGAEATGEFRGQSRVVTPLADLKATLQWLRDAEGFDLLVDLTCVDYLNYRDAADRFGLVYLLANSTSGERLTVRAFVNEPRPAAPTVSDLWEAANWLEREVWDMFGIQFAGHPDLRRILLPEEFAAHPLRKDYPLQGRGERHNFPVLKRGDA